MTKTELLRRVKRAAAARERAEAAYVEAVLAADAAGAGFAEIAAAAGVSRQAARQLVERQRSSR